MSNLGRTSKEVTFPCGKPRRTETTREKKKNGTVPLLNWEFGMPGREYK